MTGSSPAPLAAQPPRRLLLVCYEFGPHGHTGGFRWRSMVRSLVAAGWAVDVLARATDEAPARQPGDPGIADPSGATLHPVSADWPVRALRERRRQRFEARAAGLGSAGLGSAALGSNTVDAPNGDPPSVDPDTLSARPPGAPLGRLETVHAALLAAADRLDGRIWARRAVRRADALLDRRRYDVVLGTTPHLVAPRVALEVARRADVPLVIEYRDPWVFGRGPEGVRIDPLSRWLGRRAERKVLRRTAAIVDIAAGAQRAALVELSRTDPTLARIERRFIASGWDSRPVELVDSSVFRVAYVGWLWPFMPVPQTLAALGRFRRRHGLDVDAFRVEFVGVDARFGGVPLSALARGAGLGGAVLGRPGPESEVFERRGRIDRAAADARSDGAAVRLVFDSVCAHGICIPSKLYHAAQAHGDILPIGVPDGAMAEEAAKLGVATVAPDDAAGLDAALDRSFERWRAGAMTRPIDREGVFDARRRGAEMVEWLERVASGEMDSSEETDP